MNRERRTIGLAMGMAVVVGVLIACGDDVKPSGDVAGLRQGPADFIHKGRWTTCSSRAWK